MKFIGIAIGIEIESREWRRFDTDTDSDPDTP